MSETPVVLPKWGLTMLDATLVEWLKQEGERVEVDDAICLVETDKVDAEVTAPVAGVLGPPLVAEGRRRAGRDDAHHDPRGRRLGPPSRMRIDHVIIGARDIEAVADRLWERHGLASLPGGRHPGWGTHNRIVPLAGAVHRDPRRDRRERGPARPHGPLAARQHGHRRPAHGAGAARAADIERIARRLGLTLERGARERPDGSRLSWRVAGRDAGLGARPFFIAWDAPEMRPGLLERAARGRGARASATSRSAATRRGAGRLGRAATCPCARSATTAGCARS